MVSIVQKIRPLPFSGQWSWLLLLSHNHFVRFWFQRFLLKELESKFRSRSISCSIHPAATAAGRHEVCLVARNRSERSFQRAPSAFQNLIHSDTSHLVNPWANPHNITFVAPEKLSHSSYVATDVKRWIVLNILAGLTRSLLIFFARMIIMSCRFHAAPLSLLSSHFQRIV